MGEWWMWTGFFSIVLVLLWIDIRFVGGGKSHKVSLKEAGVWSDDMIEMRKTIYDLARQNPVFDFQDGVSAELSTLMQTVNQATMITGGGATTWTECVAENQKAVDYIIKEANANVAE
jgi:hypothetical protein